MLKTERANVQASFLLIDLARFLMADLNTRLTINCVQLDKCPESSKTVSPVSHKAWFPGPQCWHLPTRLLSHWGWSWDDDAGNLINTYCLLSTCINIFRWTSSPISTWHPSSPLPCQKPHQLELLFSQVKATDFVPLFNHPPSSSPLDQLAFQLRFSTTSQSCAACSLPHSSPDVLKKLGWLPLLCIQATSCPPICTDTPGSTGQLQVSWGPGQSHWHRLLPVWWWHFSGRSFPRAQSTSTTASPLNQRRLSVTAKHRTPSGMRR